MNKLCCSLSVFCVCVMCVYVVGLLNRAENEIHLFCMLLWNLYQIYWLFIAFLPGQGVHTWNLFVLRCEWCSFRLRTCNFSHNRILYPRGRYLIWTLAICTPITRIAYQLGFNKIFIKCVVFNFKSSLCRLLLHSENIYGMQSWFKTSFVFDMQGIYQTLDSCV